MIDKEKILKTSPLLCPNKIVGMDIPLDNLKFPYLVSTKYNGVRGIFFNGNILSRTMRHLQMASPVRNLFGGLLEYAKESKLILDGEFHSNTHNTVGETRSILMGTLPIPTDFMFKIFYAIPYKSWTGWEAKPFSVLTDFHITAPYVECVKQELCSIEQFKQKIEIGKRLNIEGYILLNPNAYYKHGRATLRENIIYKYKYYSDGIDAFIYDILPRKVRIPGTQSETLPTGYAKQVYKQELFVESDIAGTLCVRDRDGKEYKIPFPVGTDFELRAKYLKHFGTGSSYDLKGEWVTFKALACENRDKPMQVKQVEFRDPIYPIDKERK